MKKIISTIIALILSVIFANVILAQGASYTSVKTDTLKVLSKTDKKIYVKDTISIKGILYKGGGYEDTLWYGKVVHSNQSFGCNYYNHAVIFCADSNALYQLTEDAAGIMSLNTTSHISIAGGGGGVGWSLTGNAGTNPSTNFIGTTDNANVIIRSGWNSSAKRVLMIGDSIFTPDNVHYINGIGLRDNYGAAVGIADLSSVGGGSSSSVFVGILNKSQMRFDTSGCTMLGNFLADNGKFHIINNANYYGYWFRENPSAPTLDSGCYEVLNKSYQGITISWVKNTLLGVYQSTLYISKTGIGIRYLSPEPNKNVSFDIDPPTGTATIRANSNYLMRFAGDTTIITSNAYFQGKINTTQLSGALTDGIPTATEISGITGMTPISARAGFQCTIRDTDGSKLLYKIESDGTDWFYVIMTKAL